MRELVIPPEVFESDEAGEFIRFWIAGGRPHISLYVGGMDDEEVRQWGMMLADITAHAIRALRQNGSPLSESELLAQIEQGYLSRLKDELVDHSGSLIGSAKN